jgi:transmembrane sensor
MKGKDESVHEMSLRRDRLRAFIPRKASVHELIAEEAADWLVANREGLNSTQKAAFATWLRASPQNIEEYLNIASIGSDLRAACNDPEVSFEDLMKRALEAENPVAVARAPGPSQSMRRISGLTERARWRPQPWLSAAVAMAGIGAVTLVFVFWRNSGTPHDSNPIAYNLQTRHGEQLTQQLPDNSILKLDTDTAVSVQFDRRQRVVRVIQGRAEFRVAHEPTRRFLVQAGTVRITDIGTEFDVYARPDSTVVTVLEGRVAVAVDPRAAVLEHRRGSGHEGNEPPSRYAPVEVAAGQQVRVDKGSWPPTYIPVDTQRATAWLRRQIVFQNEPLERVAAEFNRYSATPIEIDSPALRTLAVSGVFAADDTESLIAFLRSLDGVRVEVTATRIRVSRK